MSFEETVYEVVENDERVEVCVILTQPGHVILENPVNVEIFVDDDSIYIPINSNIASKFIINCFMFLIKHKHTLFANKLSFRKSLKFATN